jgi:hypothetical protein
MNKRRNGNGAPDGWRLSALLLSCACLLTSVSAGAADFAFGAIGRAFEQHDGETALRNALAQSDADDLAFVVVNGIKSAAEPCGDDLYLRRRAMLEQAQNGVIMSLSADDWTGCQTGDGKSAAIERLNQIRELFYNDDLSFGASKLEMIRQSATPQFREYAENARWEVDGILFATLNLPSDNNHYLNYGGRNGEFEDRAIANREWLQRLFMMAANRKMAGIVLFCDADPMLPLQQRASKLRSRRDGFKEVRQQLNTLAAKYAGRVLLVHAQAMDEKIVWHGNLGVVGGSADWSKIGVNTARPNVFYIAAHKNRTPAPAPVQIPAQTKSGL